MATPKTRSKAEAEGHNTRSHRTTHTAHKTIQELPNTRKKRQRESFENEHDTILQKKLKIDVEPVTHVKSQLKSHIGVVVHATEHPRKKSEPRDRHSTNTTTTINNINGNNYEKPNHNAAAAAPIPTKHAEKVVAGIRHELDRLQPAESDTKAKDEKRKLRSQEGARFKSELSLYFPDYDVVIGNDPEETHVLNFDTPISLYDSRPPTARVASPGKLIIPKQLPPKVYPSSLFDDLHNAQRIEFPHEEAELPMQFEEDPLAPSFYDVAHKRAERMEKNIRNTEKGRAQHEKDQVIRLLEGLQGHDWLKIMGVSGFTESKKKDFVTARDHFIKGCQFIVEKFRLWKEEEKRRKDEKDRLKAEAEAEQEEDEENEELEDAGAESDGDPPDYSDVDNAAARQLHEESLARLAGTSSASSSASKRRILTAPIDTPSPVFEKPFVSFFAKPHMREAALAGTRRSGRSAFAFGHPIPQLTDQEFELPEELIDSETLRALARKRRLDKRKSK